MSEHFCVGESLDWTGNVSRLVIYTQSFFTAILAFALINNEARESLVLDWIAAGQSCYLILSAVFSFVLHQSISSLDYLTLFQLATIGFWSAAFVHWQTNEVISLQQRRYHLATRQAPFRFNKYARRLVTLGMVVWALWLVDVLVPGALTGARCVERSDVPGYVAVNVTSPFLFGLPDAILHPKESSLEQGLDILLPFYVIVTFVVSAVVWGIAWMIHEGFWFAGKKRQSPQDFTDEEWLGQLQCLWAVAAFWWMEEVIGTEVLSGQSPVKLDTAGWEFGVLTPLMLLVLTMYGLWKEIRISELVGIVPRIIGWFSNPQNLASGSGPEPKREEEHHA